MGSYKKPCIHCNRLVDSDARVCPGCGSRSPLVLRCPTCLKTVMTGDAVCSGCGRTLVVTCPHCRQKTHAHDRCEQCGRNLLVQCANRRCNEMQFFDQVTCNACGKKMQQPVMPAP